MAFQAMDAALEGFRIAREKPKAMLIWAAASLLISLVSSVGMVALFGGTLNQFMAMSREPSADPAEAFAMLGQVATLYAFLIPVALLVFAIFTSAVYRTVLRPADSAFGYLRLGAAELRMAVVLLVLFLLSMVASICIVLVLGIIGGIIGVGIGMGGDGAGAGIAMVVVVMLVYVAMIFATLAFWTKFSFAGPMTFDQGRIRIFESWGATKGHFWPLLGCYIVAGILGIVVSMLGALITMAVMMALGGGSGTNVFNMLESMQADYTSIASFLTPAMIANLVINALFSALTYAIFLAPPAVAYRDITGMKPSADTFA